MLVPIGSTSARGVTIAAMTASAIQMLRGIQPGTRIESPTPLPHHPNIVLFPQLIGFDGKPRPRCSQTMPQPCSVCGTGHRLWWDQLTGRLQPVVDCHVCGSTLSTNPPPESAG